jgi:sucrose-6-phosphate hydrolase SacC (GH32 family)
MKTAGTVLAQDRQKRGKVLLFSSPDLHQWHQESEIAGYGINGLDDAGYMWECPDLFPLGDQHVLICCPQGITRERAISTPIRQCGWPVTSTTPVPRSNTASCTSWTQGLSFTPRKPCAHQRWPPSAGRLDGRSGR